MTKSINDINTDLIRKDFAPFKVEDHRIERPFTIHFDHYGRLLEYHRNYGSPSRFKIIRAFLRTKNNVRTVMPS